MSPSSSLLFRLASSIRLGHATNSSSSHSILLTDAAGLERARQLKEAGVGSAPASEPERDQPSGWGKATRGEYGWDWFLLTEREEKLDYLWTDMYGQLRRLFEPKAYFSAYTVKDALGDAPNSLGEGVARHSAWLTSRILEHEPEPFDEEDGVELGDRYTPYIDHDSTFSFPLTGEDAFASVPHIGFARWFRDQILNPYVIIAGGNDNESNAVAAPGTRVLLNNKAYALGQADNIVLTDDEYARAQQCWDRGDHWLLYSKESGLKLRVPKVPGTEIRYSERPELVDLKVTDFCAFGCDFCYQGSTPKGKHTAMGVYEIRELLKSLDVREVALGGGEPLEWPLFWNFVNGQGPYTVNVTTRRLDLIPAHRLSHFGGIGFSCEEPALLRKQMKRLGLLEKGAYDNPWRQKLVVHIVLGATTLDTLIELCRIASKAHVPVLLLGYKTDHRGATFSPLPHEGWIDALRAAFWDASIGAAGFWKGPRLGVDTPIVERWGKEIEEKLQVDPRLMSPGEGTFSLYVDLVANTFSKASYGDHERIPLKKPTRSYKQGEELAEQILAAFRSWHA